MRLSVIFAIVLALGAVAWIASGELFDDAAAPGEDQAQSAEDSGSDERAPFEVRVADLAAEAYVEEIALFGHTQANRRVTIAAEIDGRVAEVLAEKGSHVDAGDPIARLSLYDLQAQVDQAEALLQQREMEYNAASQLGQSGYSARTSVATARANLNAAQAQLAAAREQLARTSITAPFAGVVNETSIELGSYVRTGDPVATVVDLDPVIVVAHVTERQVHEIELGAVAHAGLLSGEEVDGVIRYVSAQADEQTRTFRIEIEIPNPDRRIVDGLTANVRVPGRQIMAHMISPAVIALADDGAIGVRIVDADDRVAFVPISLLNDTADGLWVTGLPEKVTLITVGQEYVTAGQRVTPVYQPSGPPYDNGDAAS